MNNAPNPRFAFQSYTVHALDGQREASYPRLHDSARKACTASTSQQHETTYTLRTAAYIIRVSKVIAAFRKFFPAHVKSTGESLDTTHHLAVGIRDTLAIEPSLLGHIILDCCLINIPNVKTSLLMLADKARPPAMEPS